MNTRVAARSKSEIPPYLSTYITQQDASLYTAIDHASWRFILKISKAFLGKHAHQKYLKGLEETGISTDRIPLIEEMDQKLQKFGWHAVPVTGFIPPAAFMEFLSMGILPIACDMRQLEHLGYTPAPDIVHEAAGHAPIIADPEYAEYLRQYGEISRKAIYSDQDMNVYHAIRHLSDTKEDPKATPEQIQAAQARLEEAVAAQVEVSEATWLTRMGWWTFEYGMIGELTHPKIYGAGLLSSVSESFHCLGADVQKVPFSIACIEVGFDITRPQPQLFVSPDFHQLKLALEELAGRMAFRIGGLVGLERAKKGRTVTTAQLDTGVQVSGVLEEILKDEHGRPFYLKYTGPTQLAFADQEIQGQGADYHRAGFGSPVEAVSEQDLTKAGLRLGQIGSLHLSSGVEIAGRLIQVLKERDQIILLSFEECTVKKGEEFLFRPEWGTYDMICGHKIASVFGGAADRGRYLATTGGFHQDPGQQKSNLTPENQALDDLYGQLRDLRTAKNWDQASLRKLESLYGTLEAKFPQDWLLRYEILELVAEQKVPFTRGAELRQRLQEISKHSIDKKEIIERGLELI